MENCYKRGSTLPFGEDSCHEFKGHRNLAVEELPRWCFIPGTNKRSRKAVSRALNGFLNTGFGGTVYLGVTDDGVVKGLYLSQAQIDHVKIALADLMSRYKPRVTKHQYKVTFCPVMVEDCSVGVNDSGYCSGSETSRSKGHRDDMTTKQTTPHLLRTSVYCWCDKEALARYSKGEEMPMYVITIKILPFVPNVKAHKDTLQLHPVYEEEEGRCYFRRTASVRSLTHQEVADLTRVQARNHFEKVIKRMRRELVLYQNLYTSMILPTPGDKV